MLCDPEKSWEMHEEMLGTAEEFYRSVSESVLFGVRPDADL